MKTAFKFQLQKIDKHQGGSIIGRHPDSLKILRKSGLLVENVHFWKENSRTTRYNRQLLEHGAVFGFNSPEHLQLIDEFVQWANSLAGKKSA